jgi:hypothetical protein
LKETKKVEFETMVKMFLARDTVNITTRADIDGLTNRVPVLMKNVDAEYQQLLQQAITFCNLDIPATPSPAKQAVGAPSPNSEKRVKLCKYVKQNMRAL